MIVRNTVRPFRRALIRRVLKGDLKVVVAGTKGNWTLAIVRGKSTFAVRGGFKTQKDAQAFSRRRWMRDATIPKTKSKVA